jgi:hypothetical protein
MVRDGVVSAPVAEMVVVPLWPEAKVFDERLVVLAFTMAAAVAITDGVVSTPAVEIEVVAVCPTANVPAERFVVLAFWKVAVPLKVGDCENTSEPPVPVSSVTIAKSFAEVSSEVVASFELNVLQSVEVRRPRDVGEAEGRVKV